MRAWHVTGPEGPDALKPVELTDPEPGPGEVLVRLRAVSLNSRDLAVTRGTYRGGGLTYPLVPVSDGAGEIEALGRGVEGLAVGDAVMPAFFPRWISGPPEAASFSESFGEGRAGLLAEKIAVRAVSVAPLPEGFSFEQAACLPCAGVTAWNALAGPRPLEPGQTVLVLGTGGVSIFALQLARAMGAEVVATSSDDAKLTKLRQMGAKATINYAVREDWDKAVMEATGGRGADIVVEVGGPGTLERSIDALAVGGQVALIGVLSGPKAINPLGLWRKSAIARGIFVGSREMLVALGDYMVGHGLNPVVDRVFPFADAPSAFRRLASGAHFGKICISV